MGVKLSLKTAALVGVSLVLAGTSMVGAAGQPAAPAKGKAAEDTSRRVCRTIVPSGSRMGTRVCRTQAEWDEARNRTQEDVLRTQMTETTTYAPQ